MERGVTPLAWSPFGGGVLGLTSEEALRQPHGDRLAALLERGYGESRRQLQADSLDSRHEPLSLRRREGVVLEIGADCRLKEREIQARALLVFTCGVAPTAPGVSELRVDGHPPHGVQVQQTDGLAILVKA